MGIHFWHPYPNTHQQQGQAKCKHQSIVEIGLTLLARASMELKFWWEAFSATVFLLNRLPSPALNQSTPFELLNSFQPDYSFLRVFGCACYPFLKPYQRHKFSFKTSACVFLGNSPFHKRYKCLHPSGPHYIARNLI